MRDFKGLRPSSLRLHPKLKVEKVVFWGFPATQWRAEREARKFHSYCALHRVYKAGPAGHVPVKCSESPERFLPGDHSTDIQKRKRFRSYQAFLNSFSIASLAGFTYISLSFGFSTLPAGLRGMLA